MQPEDCPRFRKCGAPLCPMDPAIAKRSWFAGEEVCVKKEYQDLGWIERQKQLNDNHFRSWAEHRWTHEELVATAPQKRTLSPEHRAALVAAGERFRFRSKDPPESRELEEAQ
jgi:hypothetical protein